MKTNRKVKGPTTSMGEPWYRDTQLNRLARINGGRLFGEATMKEMLKDGSLSGYWTVPDEKTLRELLGEDDLFTNPRRRRNPTRRTGTRKKVRPRTLRKPTRRRKATPIQKGGARSSGGSSFYHAIARAGHVDVYFVKRGKAPQFVTCLKDWELDPWAKRKGITLKRSGGV